MWQPVLNKHLYGGANTTNPYSDTNQQQQDEVTANLLHLQKLHLTDLIPPPTAATHPYHAPINSANLIVPPNFATMPLSTATISHLQQYLRSHVTGDVISGDAGSKNRSGTMLPTNHHLLLSSAVDTSAAATFLTPPPIPPPVPAAALPASAVLDMSLEIFTEALLRLNRLPSHRLSQNIPQLLACNTNTTNSNASNTLIGGSSGNTSYFSGSGATANSILPLPPIPPPLPPPAAAAAAAGILLPSTTQLQSPQHFNLFKQYLTLEQHQLQQHLMALNTNTPHITTSHSPIANSYYSASKNFNDLATPLPLATPSASNCDPHRVLRKRREDLRNFFKKPHNATKVPTASISQISVDAVGLESPVKNVDDHLDDLLPPPKKKWIRHYLKGILNILALFLFFFYWFFFCKKLVFM